MLVENFCSDTSPQGITEIHRITLEEHSCGFVYSKLSTSIDYVFFFFASKLPLYCGFPSSPFSLPVTNDSSIALCATAAFASFFPSNCSTKLGNLNYQSNYSQTEHSLTFAASTPCLFLSFILKSL